MSKREKLSKGAYECHVCGYRTRTQGGARGHHSHNHLNTHKAELNWNIAMMVVEGGCSVGETADYFQVSVQRVQRVIKNVSQYPYYYELDTEVE